MFLNTIKKSYNLIMKEISAMSYFAHVVLSEVYNNPKI